MSSAESVGTLVVYVVEHCLSPAWLRAGIVAEDSWVTAGKEYVCWWVGEASTPEQSSLASLVGAWFCWLAWMD